MRSSLNTCGSARPTTQDTESATRAARVGIGQRLMQGTLCLGLVCLPGGTRTTCNSSASVATDLGRVSNFFLPATSTLSLAKERPRSYSSSPSKRASGRAPSLNKCITTISASSMSSEARKGFDEWFVENYDDLVASARAFHPDGSDLVHNTYLRTVDALERTGRPIGKYNAYFRQAMWTESTRGAFKSLYTYLDAPQIELANPSPQRDPFEAENALILTRHLAWFDRTVLQLYLDGYNLREVARQSGIPHTTLYQSLHRSKTKLRNVHRQRTNKG